MRKLICKGKIHRATVTEANLDYVGSITIDSHLMKAANILSLGIYSEEELHHLVPRVVFVDNDNQVVYYEDHSLFNDKKEVNWNDLQPRQMD
jgi:aspartate 1-decarboxylase